MKQTRIFPVFARFTWLDRFPRTYFVARSQVLIHGNRLLSGRAILPRHAFFTSCLSNRRMTRHRGALTLAQ